MSHTTFTTVQVVSVLLGTLYPILVGLVTKDVTDSRYKAILLALLSAVSGFAFEYVNSANFQWQQAVLTSVMTFVAGVAAHFGFWVPTGITAKVQRMFNTSGTHHKAKPSTTK